MNLTPTAVNWIMNSGAAASSLTVTGDVTHTSTRSFRLYSTATGSLDFSAGSLTLTGAGGDANIGGGTGGNITNTLGAINIGSVSASNGNTVTFLGTDVNLGDVSLTNASTLNIYNNAGSGTGGVTVNSLTGSADSVVAMAGLNSSSTGTLTINSTGTANYDGTVTDMSFGLGGTLAVVKTGSGTQKFTHANYYTGGTTISAGTLVINNTQGSGIGVGTVTVESGGTLAGNGITRLTGTDSVIVQSGGTIAPGDGGIGTIAFNGTNSTGPSLIMQSGAKFAMDLGAGNTSDTVEFWFYSVGDFQLNDTTIAFSNAQEGTFTLFAFYSDGGETLTASEIAAGLDLENSTGLDGFDAELGYNLNTITLTLTSTIPEPSSMSFMGIALILLISRTVRNRSKAS